MSAPQDAGFYEIDPLGNLRIKVVEYDYFTVDHNGNHPVLKTALMKVSGEVLMKNSTYFETMLGGQFKEAGRNLVEIHEDTVFSVELWFRALHGSLVDDSYLIESEEIWNAIWLTRKYFFHIEKLNDWFAMYWSRLDEENLEMHELKELLYPAQAFDHPVAFAFITKTLAHAGTGHIEEFNPSRHYELHVEGRVIRKTNQRGKREHEKEIIKGLFNPLNCFCSSNCAVNEKSLKAYVDGVRKTGIWPIETMHAKSNKDVVDSPGFIHWKCVIPNGACYFCATKLRGDHVAETRIKILNYWDGLCLDCMDISNPRTGDLHRDYWEHNAGKEWGKACRISHQRNTWYFSFMGRAELMTSFNREQQERKRAQQRQQLKLSDSDSD